MSTSTSDPELAALGACSASPRGSQTLIWAGSVPGSGAIRAQMARCDGSRDGVSPIRLWEGVAPGSESWTHDELDFELVVGGTGTGVRNVVVPTLTPRLPNVPTDRAVIVCPGGALHYLSMEAEGYSVAAWLADLGVAAFVLKYRVVRTPADEEGFGRAFMAAFEDYEATTSSTLPLAVADAERAIDIVRGDGYRHVTLLGFSAGGIVSAEVAMRSAAASRPDAAAIAYAPWVLNVVADADSPPLFVVAAGDDPFGVDGSVDLYRGWRDAGRPVELHVFERGGHGFAIHPTDLPVRHWPKLFWEWLTAHAGREDA